MTKQNEKWKIIKGDIMKKFVTLTYGMEITKEMTDAEWKELSAKVEDNEIELDTLFTEYGADSTHFDGEAFKA